MRQVLELSIASLVLAHAALAAPQTTDEDQQFLDALLGEESAGVLDPGPDPATGAGVTDPATGPDCSNIDSLSNEDFIKSLTGGCGGEPPPPPTDVMRCERQQFICTPYYRCNESDIVSDRLGLFNVRINKKQFEAEHEILAHSECRRFGDVCCTDPHQGDSPPQPEPYEPACGRRNPDGLRARITGFKEHESQFGEIPWQVAVLRVEDVGGEDRNFFVCGGSLVDERAVLTAAHCVEKLTPDARLRVRLGEWDTQNENELLPHVDVDVERFVTHVNFSSRRLNDDVALLLLSEPAPLQPHVDTLCLPDPQLAYHPADIRCVVTGWGKDAFQGGKFQTVLKQVPLPLVGHKECQNALRTTQLQKYFRLDPSFRCAGGVSGEDACTGDGGTPLACEDPHNPGRYVQLGVVSWGIGCGLPGIPGVYADVLQQVAWIREQLSSLPPLPAPATPPAHV